MSLLNRPRAREIVCDAFNSVTDLKLVPDEDGEAAIIQKTLQGLDIKFLHAIHDEIVDGVKPKCHSTLGVGGLVIARYETVGDVVDDLIASTTCP